MNIGEAQDTPATRCPACEKLLDAVSPVDHNRAMATGDLTVCFGCAAILEWLGDGYGELTPEAISTLSEELRNQLQDVCTAIIATKILTE